MKRISVYYHYYSNEGTGPQGLEKRGSAEIVCGTGNAGSRNWGPPLEEMVKIIDALFGCWHRRMSFPQTNKRGQRHSEAAMQTGTYVVCLDCGTEFAYDWKSMRVLSPSETQPFAHARLEAEANS